MSGPCQRSGQGTHGQAEAWQTRAPIYSDPPSSAEDTLTTLCPHDLLGARVLRPRRAHSLSPSNSRQRISSKKIELWTKLNIELLVIAKNSGSNQVVNNRKMITSIKDSPGDGVLRSY